MSQVPVALFGSSSDDDIGIGTLLYFRINEVVEVTHSDEGFQVTIIGSSGLETFNLYDVCTINDDGSRGEFPVKELDDSESDTEQQLLREIG